VNHTDIDPDNLYFINTTMSCGNYTTLNATNITIDSDSLVDASGSGYIGGRTAATPNGQGPGGGAGSGQRGAGGAHGGDGGDSNLILGGDWYGSSFYPWTMGSGGGAGTNANIPGGDGGGVVRIIAADALVLNGTIASNGTDGAGSCNNYVSGGGAGGTILVDAYSLSGQGNLFAVGGDGYPCTAALAGGGGGGGRIIVRYNTTAWNVSNFLQSDVSGGTALAGSNADPGEVGTIAFIDEANNNLQIVEGFRFQSIDGASFNYNIVNSTNALTRFNNSVTVNAATAINVINSTVEDTGSVTASMVTGALSFDSDSTINISGRLDLKYTTFSDTGAAYINGLGLTLEKANTAEIAWLSALSNIFNLSTHVQLGNIFAYVNSSAVAGLNQSANITFFGVNLIQPFPIVDFEDDGTFITCPGGVCTEISHVGTTYKFNVTRFTNYTLGSNYTYPNQTTPILNTTNGQDTSAENLTVYPQNVTGKINATLTNITDWFVNNKSLMVLKMPFDKNSSTVAKDYSPFQNNGTVNASIWTSAGISGGAYRFNGINDVIDCGNDSSLNPINEITVEAWINKTSEFQWGGIVGKYGVGGDRSYLLTTSNTCLPATRCINFVIHNGTNEDFISLTSGIGSLNTWYHVVGVFNGTNISIYLNGVLNNSKGTAITSLKASQVSTKIGFFPGNFYFNGSIDEVRIYNRSLTPQQIKANYNSGKPNYNTIVSQETQVNETWRACVVIVDGLVDSEEKCSNNLTILGPSAGPTIATTVPDINVLNFRLDNQIFNASFETVNASCPNCSYDLENTCQLEQEVIGGVGTFNMSIFLNGTAVNMQNIELACTMYDYAKNNLNGANCSGSTDNSSTCTNWIGGGNVFRINLSNSSNFNTSLLLGNITPVANCSTVVCYLNGTWAPGDDQEFNITKQFTVTDGTNNATNPNGTLRFTTDKYASIETFNPDINILNLRLDFQSFDGSFNTGAGLCSGCQYDLSNGTCQAEIEKVFGMFQNYNLTITLTTSSSINMTVLNMVCRTANDTVQTYPGCAGIFSSVGIGQPGCVNWVATAGRSTVLAGNSGLSIDLTNFTNITIPLGTISPTQNCKVIACEINGTWVSGDTQSFVVNKTITARAI